MTRYTTDELFSILEYSAKALGASDEELYEFTRCVRPDGRAYGTRGKCKKGTEQEKPKSESKGFKGSGKSSSSIHKHLPQDLKKHPITRDLIKETHKLAKEMGVDLSHLRPGDWRSHVSRAVSGGGYGGATQREAEKLVALAGSSLRDPKVARLMEPSEERIRQQEANRAPARRERQYEDPYSGPMEPSEERIRQQEANRAAARRERK